MGDDPKAEIIIKLEIIYKDAKPFTEVEPNFIWCQIYQMIKDQVVPDTGLEYIPIYSNIKKPAIMKVSTRPEIFPCAELISRILPREDITKMILSKINGQGFVSYNLTYVAKHVIYLHVRSIW